MVAQETDSGRAAAPPPLVVKVGGSLMAHASIIVPVLCASPRPLLVVPGGGRYADAIRESVHNDDDAHWLAIAAMDQYGRVLAAQGIRTTRRLLRPKKTCILLPYCVMQTHDPLPHTWGVTSDTIAAWVASVLGTDLLVLKSVPGITLHGALQETITEPVATDVVDPSFIPFVLKHRIRATILDGTDLSALGNYLRGKRVQGTAIGTGSGTTF